MGGHSLQSSPSGREDQGNLGVRTDGTRRMPAERRGLAASEGHRGQVEAETPLEVGCFREGGRGREREEVRGRERKRGGREAREMVLQASLSLSLPGKISFSKKKKSNNSPSFSPFLNASFVTLYG